LCTGLANCEETMVPLLNSALMKAYEFDRRRQRLSEQALSSSAGTFSAGGWPRLGRLGRLGWFAGRPVAAHCGARETRSHRSGTTDSAAVRRP
jgi:hypothetical protein